MNRTNIKRTSSGVIINTDKEALLRRRKEIEDSNVIKTLMRKVDELEKRVKDLEDG